MTSVAIVIHGHLSNWEDHKASFISAFSDYNIDVFVETYFENRPINPTVTYTTQEINDLFSGINVVGLNIDNTSTVISDITATATPYHIIGGDNTTLDAWLREYAYLEKMKKGGKQVPQGTYDIIVKTRPDISYNTVITGLEDFVKQNNRIARSMCHYYCEYILAGNQISMNYILNAVDNIPVIYNRHVANQVPININIVVEHAVRQGRITVGSAISVGT